MIMDTQNMSFIEKFELFCSYSVNQSLMKFIARKHDEKMLDYHLAKLTFRKKNRNADRLIETYSRFLNTTVEPEKKEQKKKPDQKKEIINSEIHLPDEKPESIQFRNRRKIDPDKLPPDIKGLWLQNANDYKIQRAAHEKMKVSDNNEQRSAYRETVIDLGKIIKERWNTIDAFLECHPNLSAETYNFNVNTYRSMITRALKKKELDKAQRQKLQRIIDDFLKWNIPIKPETLKKLKDKGFEIE